MGKSTLLRTLAGVQSPLGGELWVNGKLLSGYSERERSRQIGIVLTDRTMAGGLSVYDLVALGRQPYTNFLGHLNREDDAVIRKSLEAVGMMHKAGSYVAELSDGERQKASGRFHSGAASGDKTARGPARAHHLPFRLRAAIFAPGSYGFSLS